MCETVASKLIPKSIKGFWLENDDFLSNYALLRKWTPFEAACLINGVKPGKIDGGIANVGMVPVATYQYNEDPQEYTDADALITMTKIILRNHDKQTEIIATEFVDWAEKNGRLPSSSYLAKRLGSSSKEKAGISVSEITGFDLQQQLDETISKLAGAEKQNNLLETELYKAREELKSTGKHHMVKRLAILGAALNEVAAECPSKKFTKNGRLVAAIVARQMELNRDLYKLPDKHGYSYENILDTIRSAMLAGVKNCTK